MRGGVWWWKEQVLGLGNANNALFGVYMYIMGRLRFYKLCEPMEAY